MKKVIIFYLLFPVLLNGQLQRASLLENGVIQVAPTTISLTNLESRSNFQQLEGFPKAYLANSTFKNFRNLSLADLNQDGVDDIVVGINDKLIALSKDSVLWEKELVGTAIFPPTIADIDGDGSLEIAQATGGIQAPGRLYLVDAAGADLSNWPQSFNDNWVLNAPVFSDVDEDGIMEIIALERDAPAGNVHILTIEGKSFSPNWPQALDRTPAVTPSVGDIDGDGAKEIVAFSTQSIFAFKLDGNLLEGFPITKEGVKYSYQSPQLVDLNGDNRLDILAAGHGDTPEFFVRDYTGAYLSGWPQAVPFGSWTFNTPSVLEWDNQIQIFNSRPVSEEASEMLYAWQGDGILKAHFPIVKAGGLEGLISIADVDDDLTPELVFGSNLYDPTSKTSFLHAYELDGSGEVAGFPIRPKGWTFMNGAAIGDVNGDGLMDVACLTYTQNFGSAPDSAFVQVYSLEVPYAKDRVWWSTYKGDNTRAGAMERMLSALEKQVSTSSIVLYPNPLHSSAILHFKGIDVTLQHPVARIYNSFGQKLHEAQLLENSMHLDQLNAGIYFLELWQGSQLKARAKFVVAD